MTETSLRGNEILDHPADMGFRAWAPTLEDLFVETATALTSILVDLESIEPVETNTLEIDADDEEMLLYNWLSEILFQFDAEGMLYSKIEIVGFMTTCARCQMQVKVTGQKYSRDKHQVKTYVKAVTLHQLKVVRKKDTYEAQVYIDI